MVEISNSIFPPEIAEINSRDKHSSEWLLRIVLRTPLLFVRVLSLSSLIFTCDN